MSSRRLSRVWCSMPKERSSSPVSSRSCLLTDSVPSPSLWRSLASLMRSKESSGMEILPAFRKCGMEYSLK